MAFNIVLQQCGLKNMVLATRFYLASCILVLLKDNKYGNSKSSRRYIKRKMHYSTYWSVLDTPSKTIQSNLVFLFIAIGAGLLWFLTYKFKRDRGDGEKANLLWATAAFGVLGIAGYVTLTFLYPDKTNEKTLEMLNAATTSKVEGVVTNFERIYRNTRYGYETIEKFSVDSVQFAYGDAVLGKFNSFAQTNNKVIFNGQRFRITYKPGSPYGNTYNSILRLEISK